MGPRNCYKILLVILLMIALSQAVGAKTAADYINDGEFHLFGGEYNAAIDDFDTAIALNPSSARAWFDKGLTLNYQGNYGSAIQAFDRAIALDSTYDSAWYSKGDALIALGKHQDAYEAYNKAIQVNPDFVANLFGRGRALYEWGNDQGSKGDALNAHLKYQAAIGDFDRVLKSFPKHPDAIKYRQLAFEKFNSYVTPTTKAGQPLPFMVLIALVIGAVGLTGVGLRSRI